MCRFVQVQQPLLVHFRGPPLDFLAQKNWADFHIGPIRVVFREKTHLFEEPGTWIQLADKIHSVCDCVLDDQQETMYERYAVAAVTVLLPQTE